MTEFQEHMGMKQLGMKLTAKNLRGGKSLVCKWEQPPLGNGV